jgi:hypothetical protein
MRRLEPRTFRLQDAPSLVTIASNSGFNVYSDRSGRRSGSLKRELRVTRDVTLTAPALCVISR